MLLLHIYPLHYNLHKFELNWGSWMSMYVAIMYMCVWAVIWVNSMCFVEYYYYYWNNEILNVWIMLCTYSLSISILMRQIGLYWTEHTKKSITGTWLRIGWLSAVGSFICLCKNPNRDTQSNLILILTYYLVGCRR